MRSSPHELKLHDQSEVVLLFHLYCYRTRGAQTFNIVFHVRAKQPALAQAIGNIPACHVSQNILMMGGAARSWLSGVLRPVRRDVGWIGRWTKDMLQRFAPSLVSVPRLKRRCTGTLRSTGRGCDPQPNLIVQGLLLGIPGCPPGRTLPQPQPGGHAGPLDGPRRTRYTKNAQAFSWLLHHKIYVRKI